MVLLVTATFAWVDNFMYRLIKELSIMTINIGFSDGTDSEKPTFQCRFGYCNNTTNHVGTQQDNWTNLASYPHRDGKWVLTSQIVVMLWGWELKAELLPALAMDDSNHSTLESAIPSAQQISIRKKLFKSCVPYTCPLHCFDTASR